MGATSAISGGLGAGMGLYNVINGAKEAKEASRALSDYERQKLTNVAEGLQVSTLGADLQREEASRLASTSVDALREAGTRGIIGGLGRVSANNNNVNREISANLDAQQKSIDQIQAEDDARIRNMTEQREIGDINALSSQVQAGKQDMNMGMANIVQGVGGIGNSIAGMSKGLPTDATATTAPSMVDYNVSSKAVAPISNDPFSANGTGLFATPKIPSVGFGRTPRGYDFSGQPIYN